MRREYGPERLAGQGLDPNQYDSGDRTITALLGEAPARDHSDCLCLLSQFVATQIATRHHGLLNNECAFAGTGCSGSLAAGCLLAASVILIPCGDLGSLPEASAGASYPFG